MQFVIQPPSQLEVKTIDTSGDKLQVTPALVRGQHMLRVGYITAKGDGGTESRAVVLFNANTGVFSLQSDKNQVTFPFDRPKAEFERTKREQSRNGSKSKNAKTN